MSRYKTLVLKGGGVKGMAYVGAAKALEEAGLLPQVDEFAGTSAGAIMAALLAAGYGADELKEIFTELDFRSFEDHEDPLRLVTRYGLYEGSFFLKWITESLGRKLAKANPTFADLPHGLSVFATNMNTRGLAEFSKKETPTVAVGEAVRCSMSIPFVFSAYQLAGQIYVDGGVLLNYPFLPFEQRPPGSVLGLYLADLSAKAPTTYDVRFDDVVSFTKGLFETVVAGQQPLEVDLDSQAGRQSVLIDDEGISATDFEITAAQKQQLYDNGYRATRKYLELHPA
ncbi:MAG TPA: patatin-like phospholipase family protein [Vicinamibacteria bacterium]